MHKNFKNTEKVVFGNGAFSELENIIAPKRKDNNQYFVFIVDHFFQQQALAFTPAAADDVHYINVDIEEPTTQLIDHLRDDILARKGLPSGVVGIGGGSVMDIAKALSLMFTNEGSATLYQGLNLIKKQGIYHVGVPTISGTGAEVSMTAVLTGPEKKLGLKCEWTVFDQIILDPELSKSVPHLQWFYTGMDTYIHCIESETGQYKNAFSAAYAQQALSLCYDVFLNEHAGQNSENNEKLMIASMMGGLSLTYSEVGVCHALSYGLSKILGYHHGYANCVAFQHLKDYYGEGVSIFNKMLERNNITLPQNLANNWSEEQIHAMAQTAYNLPHMWKHAVGDHWQDVVSLDDIKSLYRRL